MIVREYQRSLVRPEARFNLVYVSAEEKQVSVVSFDPVEQKVLAIVYPTDLEISSRSVGSYSISQLYTLGSYRDKGGEFVRRKVQGFMRLPIRGYLISTEPWGEEGPLPKLSRDLRRTCYGRGESNLSKIDCLRLVSWLGSSSERTVREEELVRSGIIVIKDGKKTYVAERLFEYVGQLFFDWRVGREGARVAVINESGESGLGTDLAMFLEHVGLDVVSVRGGESQEEKSRLVIMEPDKFELTLKILTEVFDMKIESGDTAQHRADMVFFVGTDTLELF